MEAEITEDDYGGGKEDVKEHFIPEEAFGEGDEVTEGEEAEHSEDGGVFGAGFPSVEKVDEEAIEGGGEERGGERFRAAGTGGEGLFGGGGVGVFEDLASEAAEDAEVVEGEGEDEGPGLEAEEGNEEEGEDVFGNGAGEDEEESCGGAEGMPGEGGGFRGVAHGDIEGVGPGEAAGGEGEKDGGGDGGEDDGGGGDGDGGEEGGESAVGEEVTGPGEGIEPRTGIADGFGDELGGEVFEIGPAAFGGEATEEGGPAEVHAHRVRPSMARALPREEATGGTMPAKVSDSMCAVGVWAGCRGRSHVLRSRFRMAAPQTSAATTRAMSR